MKPICFILLLLTALLLPGCSSDVTVPAETVGTDALPITSVTEPPQTERKEETTPPKQREYLWTNGVRYIAEEEQGYGIYDIHTDDLLAVCSDFRLRKRFDREGNIIEACYVIVESEGTKALMQISGFDLILNRKFEKSIGFYGDYTVIDGYLYTPGMRIFGQVSGEPSEASPTLTDTVTFPASGDRIIFVPGDVNGWLDNTDTVMNLAGDAIAAVQHGNGYYTCLHRNEDGFYAKFYYADLGGYTPAGYYVHEKLQPVELWHENEHFNFYRTQEGVTWATDKQDALIGGFEGTVEPFQGFLVYHPADLQMPVTLLTQEGEVYLDKVAGYSTNENGILVWYYDNFQLVTDSEGREGGYTADSMLGFINAGQNLTVYGKFDRILDVTGMCALTVSDGKLSLIGFDGTVLTTFDGWNEDMRYVETRLPYPNTGAQFVFSAWNADKKNADTVIFRYEIPEEMLEEVLTDTISSESTYAVVTDFSEL